MAKCELHAIAPQFSGNLVNLSTPNYHIFPYQTHSCDVSQIDFQHCDDPSHIAILFLPIGGQRYLLVYCFLQDFVFHTRNAQYINIEASPVVTPQQRIRVVIECNVLKKTVFFGGGCQLGGSCSCFLVPSHGFSFWPLQTPLPCPISLICRTSLPPKASSGRPWSLPQRLHATTRGGRPRQCASQGWRRFNEACAK